jgi:hypothetical protein
MAILMNMETTCTLRNRLVATFGQWYLFHTINLATIFVNLMLYLGSPCVN